MNRVLRITSEEDIEGLPANIRAQIERSLNQCVCDCPADGPAEPPRKIQKRTKPNRPEEAAGIMLVEWIDLVVMPNGLRPGAYFYHVPNGGGRSKAEAGLLKAQGVRKGVPDYNLDLPLGRYHALRLELKAPDGAKPTAEQLDRMARLESVGFKCCVAWGFDEAKEQIEKYLDLAN